MDVSPLVRNLLEKRGVVGEEAQARFLAPDYERDTHDPFLLPDMDRAVARILLALEQGERIAVYGDFDCDGIPGAALLHQVFHKLGHTALEVYIPHRDEEGHGFHAHAVDELHARGVSLIITVDVGTTAVEAVAHAKELGMDCIITDHHDVSQALPDCIVINPQKAGYPFPGLSGTGVAFKVAQALMIEGKKRGLERFISIPDGWEKWLLDLVAIATVADMMPLIDENRALVYWGLKVLRKSRRPGLIALATAARMRLAEATEDDIGFSIAPRINAASRMGTPELAFRLLSTDSKEEAESLAAELERLNASRKAKVAAMVKEARKRMDARFTPSDAVAVLGDPEWKPGLLGLVATSLLSGRKGVVCVWGRDAKGNLKGSCRTDGSVSVVDLFSRAEHLFEEWGGHRASGGFTVKKDGVHTLAEELARAHADLPDADEGKGERGVDGVITVTEAGWSLYADVAKLAPFGIGNPKPVFECAATVAEVRSFGKEKNHVELSLAHENGRTCRAFQFFCTAEDFSHTPVIHASVRVLSTLERDTFRGRTAVALRVVDVLPASC